VDQSATHVVAVFGQIREMREITERANDRHGLARTEPFEERIEIAARRFVGLTLKGDREAPDRFNDLEGIFAVLLANRVAQDLAQQP
jgi:hypothetical protein